MCSKRIQLWIAAVLSAAILALGCRSGSHSDGRGTDTVPSVTSRSPVRIAVLQDKTGSTGWTRTPQLTTAQLDLLIEVLRPGGGELGFGLIRDQSDRGLVRLRIDPPPEPVATPRKTGRPFKDVRLMEQYRADQAKFHQMLSLWETETDLSIARFRKDVQPLLDRRANAKSTDIWGAVRRADLFLAEDDAAWGCATHRWAVFASDGLHNRRVVKPAPFRSGARVLVINSAAQFGSLTALRAEAFESVEAAFRHISAIEGGQK
jgi:hypothetical protein